MCVDVILELESSGNNNMSVQPNKGHSSGEKVIKACLPYWLLSGSFAG